MKFIGKDGQEVELKILGYQFPTDIGNDWDANWLKIYVNVKSNVGQWQAVDPCLTTWEFNQLIEWFSNLSKERNHNSSELTFVEPNLSLRVIDKSEFTSVQINFDLELKPESAYQDKEYFVIFQFSNEDLATIADELALELYKFPIRPFPENISASNSIVTELKPWWKFW